MRRSLAGVSALCLSLSVMLAGSAGATRGSAGLPKHGSKKLYACVEPPYRALHLIAAAKACAKGQQKISWIADNGRLGAAGSAGAASTPTAFSPSFFSAVLSMPSPNFSPLPSSVAWLGPNGQPGIVATTADMSLSNDNATLVVGTPGIYLVNVSVSSQPDSAPPNPLALNGDTLQLLRNANVVGSTMQGLDWSATLSLIVSVATAGTTISVRDVPATDTGYSHMIRLTGGSFSVIRIG